MKRRFGCILVSALVLAALVAAQTATSFPRLLSDQPGLYAPFASGERLVFEVNWKPVFFFPAFKAGEITLSSEESTFQGHDTYRLQAWAVSDGALSKVAGIEIKNHFESQVDRRTFRSLRFFQATREGDRHRDLELIFDYEKDVVQIHETDPSSDPPRVIRNTTRRGIPGPAVDVISVFYVVRLRRFSSGDNFLLDLNERGDFREVRVVALDSETVETPIGKYPSIKLSTKGGLFRQGGDFRAWFATEGLRNPTSFEADVRFGKVYGSLIRLDTPQLIRGVIRVP
jgi:hypothetical protein